MATPGGLGAFIAVPASQCIYRVVTPGQAIDLDETELVRRIPLHPLKLPEWGCWPARLSGLWTRSRRRPAATVAAVARLAETDRSVHRPGDLGEVVGIAGARYRAYAVTIFGEAPDGPGPCPARRQLTAAPDGATNARARTGQSAHSSPRLQRDPQRRRLGDNELGRPALRVTLSDCGWTR